MPVKFDDIPKMATEVLNDDYQTSGHVFKAKQKTSYGGMVASTQVDFFKDKAVATPAKLTWKWPTPFGVKDVNFDKIEMDKSGKIKVEASATQLVKNVKFDCKTADVTDVSKVSVACTYDDKKLVQFKFECKAMNPTDFNGELTVGPPCNHVALGAKFNSSILAGGLPDFGARYWTGPFFASLSAKEKFSAFNVHAFYKANDDLKCAATYQHGGKANGNFTVGASYQGLYKVKFAQDQTVSVSAKRAISKGFTVLGGCSYNIKSGAPTYGLQLSVE